MAYLIEGVNRPLVYCANYRTGSTVLGATLLKLGGRAIGHHHAPLEIVPPNAIVAETVRHHLDVFVSFWCKQGCKISFPSFVQFILDGKHPYLTNGQLYGKFKSNYLLRWETLKLEWDTLCIEAGLPYTVLATKNSKRPPGLYWKDLLDRELQQAVYRMYRDEMEWLGYGIN